MKAYFYLFILITRSKSFAQGIFWNRNVLDINDALEKYYNDSTLPFQVS
jgi:hypothetical protein